MKKIDRRTFLKGMGVVSGAAVLAGCGSSSSSTASSAASGSNTAANDTLVYGEDSMDGKFSPFFYTAVPDEDVVNMLHLSLLGADREGGIVLKGIKGETRPYNGTDYTYTGIADCDIVENADGTVDYNITMRDDIKFSDGTTADIDDVIFGIYVLCDPTYDGSSTFSALPVEGMAAYRTGMDTLANLLATLGEDNTDFSLVTEEQQKAFWDAVNNGGTAYAQEIVDYLIANGHNSADDSVATCAANWGYDLAADADAKDFFLAIGEAYGWSFASMEAESAGSALADLIPEDVYKFSEIGVKTGDSAASITGVKRTGDYSMTLTMTKIDATAIYQVAGIPVVPMHYYGDESKYDYNNNSFGFTKGDLSVVKSVTTAPIGGGPYTFNSFTNGTVTLDANPLYYKGEPKIAHINFMTLLEADKVNAVDAGTVDITSPSFSNDTIDEITAINGTADFDGPVITINTVNNLGYGYVGICAKNVCVNGEPGSDASKNLRKAIATVISVYRDEAIDSYYGERANVINYPISDTSWAAPRVTDEGYKIAFSTDVNGNAIYSDSMSEEEKYAAALQAALGFFEAAGYTVADGKLTAAPKGAKLEYELIIPAGGTGDHPNFMIVANASAALKTIGFNLIITDVSDGTVTIGNNLNAGTAELWTMAWQATADPDMYQIYYSDVANGGANKGGSSHYYYIQDAELDQWIMEARQSFDQSYRKVLYKQCLDRVVDWACEIPIYQRLNCVIFSSERINLSTLTPDITTYWGWGNDIEQLELN